MSGVANNVELYGGPFDGTRVDVLLSTKGPWTDLQMAHPTRTLPLGVFDEHACWYRLWHHQPERALYQPIRKDPT